MAVEVHRLAGNEDEFDPLALDIIGSARNAVFGFASVEPGPNNAAGTWTGGGGAVDDKSKIEPGRLLHNNDLHPVRCSREMDPLVQPFPNSFSPSDLYFVKRGLLGCDHGGGGGGGAAALRDAKLGGTTAVKVLLRAGYFAPVVQLLRTTADWLTGAPPCDAAAEKTDGNVAPAALHQDAEGFHPRLGSGSKVLGAMPFPQEGGTDFARAAPADKESEIRSTRAVRRPCPTRKTASVKQKRARCPAEKPPQRAAPKARPISGVNPAPPVAPSESQDTNDADADAGTVSARIDAFNKGVDVICGRGGRSNNNPGNKRYTNKGNTLKADYKESIRARMREITQQLINFVLNGKDGVRGRFLKTHQNKNFPDSWQELSGKEILGQSVVVAPGGG